MDPSMADRAQRITPQEWRVIALSIEGVPAHQACESLGIALGTLESHKQAIRRKLGIAKGTRFETFVRDHFAGGIPVPEKPVREERAPATGERPEDRRVRWLLRISLDELSELAMSTGLRAQLLDQTVQRMGSDDAEAARREVEDLRGLSVALKALREETIAKIRARGGL